MKIYPLIFIITFLAVGFVFGIYQQFTLQDNKFNCDKPFDVHFLKLSETSEGSKLLQNKNVVVVYPEANRVVANTEVLDCPNFKYSDYLNKDMGLF